MKLTKAFIMPPVLLLIAIAASLPEEAAIGLISRRPSAKRVTRRKRPRAIGGRRNWRSAFTQIGEIAK